MYRISYEKCVCFIFLVILAVLSCSGFRIDNLAMTDISKRNFHTSSSFSNSDEFFDRIFNVRSSPSVDTITPTYRHKIRHHRQLRAQAHNSHRRYDPQKPPTGHIDVQVFPPRAAGFPPTTHPSEHFAQIPSTDIHHPLFPTRPIVTRSQRSSDNKRHQWQHSQEEDISRKAFRAEIVVLAQAESGSTCECFFKVNTTFKNTKQFPVNDRILLKIPCDKDEKSPKSKNLVRNKIQLGKSYILFLNASNAHTYWSVDVPKMIRPIKRAKIEKVIKRVCKTKFEIR
ncbi:uncharacterized protein LOC108917624 [Anoplophora glabripennis]|uniref:uncharacterized protein LOC108917624 n=1 Tax=Anoplophora glabripennis TaxID=217634 RepID=UPI000C771984|nr:uncharacterized protein LOC108917624 [Anoplophora glabripennis]